MGKNDKKTLSWDSFQSLGNPENVPEEQPQEKKRDTSAEVRIHLEKKHRGGKEVAIIRGLELNDDELKILAKELKTKCGVGGSSKNGEILIQGNMRPKLLEILKEKGYKNTKLAGG
jgi:translation initiation factor 1